MDRSIGNAERRETVSLHFKYGIDLVAATRCSIEKRETMSYKTIRDLAAQTGVTESALRYYDEEEKEDAEEPEEKKQESNSEQKQKKKSDKSDSGSSVSADFKKTMDEYESFMNDYVDFMKKYEDSDDVSGMLEDYSSMVDKYSKFEEKIDAIDEDELSSADYAYYTKVTGRVTEKLSELN